MATSMNSEGFQLDLSTDQSAIPKSKFPTKLSDLTFQSSLDPAINTNIYKVLSTLRKSTLSIPNRLISILQDADFIRALFDHLTQHCFSHYMNEQPTSLACEGIPQSIVASDGSTPSDWPLVPNERSGSWPLPPHLKFESQGMHLSSKSARCQTQPVSAYFKSTDGHVNQWSFSTRRLNLPVLSLLGSAGGAILVDTTRRGKAYPDALRRTVPIFTTVWNHLLFQKLEACGVCDFQAFGLEKGEISQVEKRIPGFLHDLKGLDLDIADLRHKLARPIRCLWVSQPSGHEQWGETFEKLADQVKAERTKWKSIGGVNILICCSASRRVIGAEMSDDGYIQGAGDDSEGWSQGLTAKIFWDNYEEIMTLVEIGTDVDDLVKDLVHREKNNRDNVDGILVKPTRNIFLGAGQGDARTFDLVVDCNATFDENTAKRLNLGCKEGKLGSKMLRDKLSTIRERLQRLFSQQEDAKILVVCSTGKDLSVGVILTILCSFCNDSGLIQLGQIRDVDKQFIKQRLAWVTTSKPNANPSRATLQAVNSFLINRPN